MFQQSTTILLDEAPQAILTVGVEVLLVDQTSFGGSTVADFLNLPFINVCCALMLNTEGCNMARFLICTISVTGHVSPALPIARKLVDHGHQVYWYTESEFQAKVESIGAHFIPAVDISPE